MGLFNFFDDDEEEKKKQKTASAFEGSKAGGGTSKTGISIGGLKIPESLVNIASASIPGSGDAGTKIIGKVKQYFKPGIQEVDTATDSFWRDELSKKSADENLFQEVNMALNKNVPKDQWILEKKYFPENYKIIQSVRENWETMLGQDNLKKFTDDMNDRFSYFDDTDEFDKWNELYGEFKQKLPDMEALFTVDQFVNEADAKLQALIAEKGGLGIGDYAPIQVAKKVVKGHIPFVDKLIPEHRTLNTAKSLSDELKAHADKRRRYMEEESAITRFSEGMAEKLWNKESIPFIGKLLSKDEEDEIKRVSEKYLKDKNSLTEDEQLLMELAAMRNSYLTMDGGDWAGTIGQGVAVGIPFSLEFMAMSGASEATLAASSTRLNNFLKGKNLFGKSVEGVKIVDGKKAYNFFQRWVNPERAVLTGAIQAAYNFPSVMERQAQLMQNVIYTDISPEKDIELYVEKNDKNVAVSWLQAYTDTFIEQYTERAGVTIDNKIRQGLGKAVASKWLTKMYGNSKFGNVAKFLTTLDSVNGSNKAFLDTVGIHGLAGETYEELINSPLSQMNSYIFGDKDELPKPGKDFWSAKELATIIGVSAFTAKGWGVLNMAHNKIATHKQDSIKKQAEKVTENISKGNTGNDFFNDMVSQKQRELGITPDIIKEQVQNAITLIDKQGGTKSQKAAFIKQYEGDVKTEVMGEGTYFTGKQGQVKSEDNNLEIETDKFNLKEFTTKEEVEQYITDNSAETLAEAIENDDRHKFDGAIFVNPKAKGEDTYFISNTEKLEPVIQERDMRNAEEVKTMTVKFLKKIGLGGKVSVGLVNNLGDVKALGTFTKEAASKGFIGLKTGKVHKTTGYHEIFHAATEFMMTTEEKKDMIKEALNIPSVKQRVKLLKKANGSMPLAQAVEEILAQEFANYEVGKESQPALQKVFEYLLDTLKKIFGAFNSGKASQLQKFVTDLHKRKSPTARRAAILAEDQMRKEMIRTGKKNTLRRYQKLASMPEYKELSKRFFTLPYMQNIKVSKAKVKDLLRQTPLKAIEKQIINGVLDTQFHNKERFSPNVLQQAVESELIPLDIEVSGIYAGQGSENLGYEIESSETHFYKSNGNPVATVTVWELEGIRHISEITGENLDRIIKEEIRMGAIEGKKALRIPTEYTAGKIKGFTNLGDVVEFTAKQLTPEQREELKPYNEAVQHLTKSRGDLYLTSDIYGNTWYEVEFTDRDNDAATMFQTEDFINDSNILKDPDSDAFKIAVRYMFNRINNEEETVFSVRENKDYSNEDMYPVMLWPDRTKPFMMEEGEIVGYISENMDLLSEKDMAVRIWTDSNEVDWLSVVKLSRDEVSAEKLNEQAQEDSIVEDEYERLDLVEQSTKESIESLEQELLDTVAEVPEQEFKQTVEETKMEELERQMKMEFVRDWDWGIAERGELDAGYKKFKELMNSKARKRVLIDGDIEQIRKFIPEVDTKIFTSREVEPDNALDLYRQRYSEEQSISKVATSEAVYNLIRKEVQDMGYDVKELMKERPYFQRALLNKFKKGVKEGVKEGKAEAKAKAKEKTDKKTETTKKRHSERIEKMKELDRTKREYKKILRAEAKGMPRTERLVIGSMIDKLDGKNQQTIKDKYGKILESIAEYQEEISKDRLVENIAKNITRAKLSIRTGSYLDVGAQTVIQSVIDQIDLKTPTQATIEALQSIVVPEGVPVVPKEIADKVARLQKVPLKEMSLDELRDWNDVIATVMSEGSIQYYLSRINEEKAIEMQVDDAVATGRNLDPMPKDKSKMKYGEDFLKAVNRDEIKLGRKAKNKKLALDLLSFGRVADIMSGGNNNEIKSVVEGNVSWDVRMAKKLYHASENANATADVLTEEMLDRIRKEVKSINQTDKVNISLYKLYQEGAYDQVVTLMDYYNVPGAKAVMNYVDIAKVLPELTPKQMKVYEIVRDIVTRNSSAYAYTHETLENKPFEWIKNYAWPIIYKAEITEQLDPAMLNDTKIYGKASEVNKGSTIGRKQGVPKVPDIEILDIARRALVNQQRYIQVQPVLTQIKKVVTNRRFKENRGKIVVDQWLQRIDDVVRNGNGRAGINPFLRSIRVVLTQALLGFKLTTIAVQPMAMLENIYALKPRELKYAPEFLIKGVLSFLTPLTSHVYGREGIGLGQRQGNEIAYNDMVNYHQDRSRFSTRNPLNWIGRLTKIASKYAFKPIQYTDIKTAFGVGRTYYDIFKRNGVDHEQAKMEADWRMALSQNAIDPSIRPHIFNTGDTTKLFLTLQSFAINKSQIFVEKLSTTFGSQKLGGGKGVLARMVGLVQLTLFIVMLKLIEEEVRSIAGKTTRAIAGGKPYTVSSLEDMYKTAVWAIPEEIPLLGSALESSIRYGNVRSGMVPIDKMLELWSSIAVLATHKKIDKLKLRKESGEWLSDKEYAQLFFEDVSQYEVDRAYNELGGVIGAVFGIPVTSIATELHKGYYQGKSDREQEEKKKEEEKEKGVFSQGDSAFGGEVKSAFGGETKSAFGGEIKSAFD